MHWVIVLRSTKSGKHHVDCAGDPDARLHDHNSGKFKATRFGGPWEIVHREGFDEWTSAVSKEQQITSIGPRRYMLSLGR